MSSPDDPRRARSYRARGVVAALLTLPLLELLLLILVARAVGVLTALGLLLVGTVAGVLVLRWVGTNAVRRFAGAGDPVVTETETGEVLRGVPVSGTAGSTAQPTQAALLVPAGLLLIVPGFLSDLVGLALLVPAVRRRLATRLGEAVLRRIQRGTVRIVPGEVVTGPFSDQVGDAREAGDGPPPTRPPILPPPR